MEDVLVPNDLKNLPKKQRLFIQEYIRTGLLRESYVAVGYLDNKRSMRNARQLRSNLSRYIKAELGAYVTSTEISTVCIATLMHLMRNSTSDQVRLNAAEKLLTRGGHDAPTVVTHNHNHKSLTDKQLDSRIGELMDQLKPATLKLVANSDATETGIIDADVIEIEE
jgi:hypothetical protein